MFSIYCMLNLMYIPLVKHVNIFSQVQGKYYVRIDSLGEGAKWRRSFGQEIYSPLLLAFTEQVMEIPAFFFTNAASHLIVCDVS